MIGFETYIREHIVASKGLLSLQPKIDRAISMIHTAFLNNNKLLICGNGGSAADAQHISTELVGRFRYKRRALPAIALSTDTSLITAWSNDYSFDSIFSRQIEALGQPDDVLLAISTSGNSTNIINAMNTAHEMKMNVIGLTRENSDGMKVKDGNCNIILDVPSELTSIIQELHQIVYHYICMELEKKYCEQ